MIYKKSLVSVIVPIYNVEQYLCRCLDSIIRQTYTDIEIILVNDGSTDKCPQICDDYAKKDKRIKVVHQENGGLAHARNIGIANAIGEFVTFIDSDDLVALNYVECLFQGICEYGADISIASFHTFENDCETSDCYAKIETFTEVSKKDAVRRYSSIKASVSMPFISACNKLYDRRLFEEILFPKGKLYEDAFTTYKLIDKAEKMIFTSTGLYFYRINPNSIIGQSFKEKHLEMTEAFRGGMDYFSNKNEKDLSDMFIPPLLMRDIYCWWGAKTILKNAILSQKVIDDYRKNCKKIKYRKNVSLLWFVIFNLISLCPWLYICYRRLNIFLLGDRRC